MAEVQALPALSYGPSRGSSSRGGGALPSEFPAGMRILVVDDDLICLEVLRRMLVECLYEVTTCCRATAALSLLREKKGSFDVVLSDVHMPGMDGFELLELVGIEMNLPVVMISADGRTSAVMSGITRGAVDYLIKPVRMEELRNIWQHVVRRKRQGNKDRSDSLEDSDCNRQVTNDADHDFSVNYGSDGPLKSRRKKRETGENDDDELDNGDPSSKKARVVWSVELHRQFVDAVNQLGIDKAVPKKILELMNVPGITRENVASHLQKYRMYLRRLSGAALQLRGLPDSYFGAAVTNANAQLLDSLGFPALSASGQIPPQTLAALEAELLRQSSGSLAVSAMGQPILQQATVQGPNRIPVEQGAILGQPLMNFQTNMSNRFPQPNIAGSSDNLGVLNSYRRGISMPPSCLVGPSQPLNSFRMGDNPILLSQNLMVGPSRVLENSPVLMNRNSIVVPSQSPSSFQAENALIPTNINTGYNDVSTNFYFGLLSSQSNNLALDIGQGLGENFNISNIQESGTVAGTLPDQGPGGISGLLGEDNCNPDEYLVDDIASPIDNLSQRNIPMGDEEESEEARDFLEFYRQS